MPDHKDKARAMILRSWFENEFHKALCDEEKLRMAGAVLKVGVEKKEPWQQCVRIMLASFVGELIAPDVTEGNGANLWLNRN